MRAAAIADLLERDHAAAGSALDRALMTLHGSGDTRELCALHLLAVRYWRDDPAQAAFHRTHAYVYALESGDTQAEAALHRALAEDGRI